MRRWSCYGLVKYDASARALVVREGKLPTRLDSLFGILRGEKFRRRNSGTLKEASSNLLDAIHQKPRMQLLASLANLGEEASVNSGFHSVLAFAVVYSLFHRVYVQ